MDRSDWNPSKVTDKEHPEINTWKNGRTSAFGKVWSAFFFQPGVETVFLEKPVEAGIKRMSAPGWQIAGRYSERFLFWLVAFAYGHRNFFV